MLADEPLLHNIVPVVEIAIWPSDAPQLVVAVIVEELIVGEVFTTIFTKSVAEHPSPSVTVTVYVAPFCEMGTFKTTGLALSLLKPGPIHE